VRLGVSAKILLAYAVLLAAFAGNATFTVLTIHRARQGVVANQAYLDLQSSVDTAWKSLNDFAGALGRDLRKQPNLALALRMTHKNLDEALAAIDRYLEREPTSFRRPDFEAKRRQIQAFKGDLDKLSGQMVLAESGSDEQAWPEFESQFANLTHGLNRLRRPLRGESAQIAQRLADDEENAMQMALALGGLGLVVAGLAVAFVWRILRPLQVLRSRAREIAGGEYARRTGVSSRDEIGDLARELDAMAAALEERELRLIRSERMATVGRMAAQITHEVRNPLASIGLYAELLCDELGSESEPRRLVESITSEVDRLTEITETYLRFARLPRPQLEAEDLGELVASIVEFSRAELSNAGIRLEVDLGPEPFEAAVDENQIRQALLNLIRNAREAMAAAGVTAAEGAAGGAGRAGLAAAVAGAAGAAGGDLLRVALRARAEGLVEIVVSDTGPGIRSENLPKVFDPFFSTKAKGTGLGLPLVQQIAVEHGGRIEVESSAAGTAFHIVLPRLGPAGAHRSPADAGLSAGNSAGADEAPVVHATIATSVRPSEG
jgi:signal transduction histidine kinase